MHALRQVVKPHLGRHRRGLLFPRASKPIPPAPRDGSPARGQQGRECDAAAREPAADPDRQSAQHGSRIATRIFRFALPRDNQLPGFGSSAVPAGLAEPARGSRQRFLRAARQSRPGAGRAGPSTCATGCGSWRSTPLPPAVDMRSCRRTSRRRPPRRCRTCACDVGDAATASRRLRRWRSGVRPIAALRNAAQLAALAAAALESAPPAIRCVGSALQGRALRVSLAAGFRVPEWQLPSVSPGAAGDPGHGLAGHPAARAPGSGRASTPRRASQWRFGEPPMPASPRRRRPISRGASSGPAVMQIVIQFVDCAREQWTASAPFGCPDESLREGKKMSTMAVKSVPISVAPRAGRTGKGRLSRPRRRAAPGRQSRRGAEATAARPVARMRRRPRFTARWGISSSRWAITRRPRRPTAS